MMNILHLTDAKLHADGWIIDGGGVTHVWNWEESHRVFLIHREFPHPFDELTELHVQGHCIQQWAGLHMPEDIWDDISDILLMYHDIICAPLEAETIYPLPTQDGP